MTSSDQLDMLNARANGLHGQAILAKGRGDTDRLAEIRLELIEIGRQTDLAGIEDDVR